jgi:hypothetical protein
MTILATPVPETHGGFLGVYRVSVFRVRCYGALPGFNDTQLIRKIIFLDILGHY